MARRRLQPHFVIEFMVHIDKHSSSGLDDWQGIILKGADGIARGHMRGLELTPRHVTGVGNIP
ncbi:hypothetical protein [Mesorhizobium sp. Root552]|uniref:hypothetical protein n=1 Tax=Mesorhizobium sp. Root552 TaxID=1736555 RepID=UPI001AEBB9DE|nr:hypothetical protein [Mesorhizobium sp. Root552]